MSSVHDFACVASSRAASQRFSTNFPVNFVWRSPLVPPDLRHSKYVAHYCVCIYVHLWVIKLVNLCSTCGRCDDTRC